MGNPPEQTTATAPATAPVAAADLFALAPAEGLPAVRAIVMKVLASGGVILRHRIPAVAPAIPLRFTLHAPRAGADPGPADSWDDGADLPRAIVRALLVEGLIDLGPMPPDISVPRQIRATDKGIGFAVAEATGLYLAAIAQAGADAVPLTAAQRDLVCRLHDDAELRLQQYGPDSFRLAEYPPPRRFDAEPLINIGFLYTGDPDGAPVVWRLGPAGTQWARKCR